jgi:ATP-dependent Lon protease
MFPDPEADIPNEAIEWATKLALECRRRVKEQQKRIGAAEFRNTHFSFTRYPDGIEQFVSTPELHNENSIGSDPLPAGQVWALSPGGTDENPGLFRIEVTEGPGSGLKILNQSPPGSRIFMPEPRSWSVIAIRGRTSLRSSSAHLMLARVRRRLVYPSCSQ